MSENIGATSPTDSLTSEDVHPSEDSLQHNENDVTFDLQVVLDGFKKCKRDDEQIYMDDYLRGYIELNKFFQLLGSVFNFVASDVQKKITILECYRKGGAGDFYYSIQSMIEYEKDNSILESTEQQSGSRTLLRLHRALEFIIGFLEELKKASLETKLGSISSEIYNRTLAKHHSWILGKTVSAVLYLMPTKQVIVEKVTKGDMEIYRQHESLLPEVIEVMQSVFNLTQKLYEDYDILNLP
ncbi:UNVERIFIED_CONTAM: hypothetical protein RMT77_009180 [Armadillidium vulgare]|nr:Ceramide-1-phosphate transfer protein [Armadillidium vulgare]